MERKFLIALICGILQANFAQKYSGWWLLADHATIYSDSLRLKNLKLSRCNNKKPFWYLSAKSAQFIQNKVLLDKAQLKFGALELPLLFKELPINGEGRSGLLPVRFGYNMNLGNYMGLPLYFWISKNNSLELMLRKTQNLGHLYSLKANINDFKLWWYHSKHDHIWRFKGHNKFINYDWSDTNSKDLFWLWGLDSMNIMQGRLTRYARLLFNWGTVEVVEPKVLNSSFDKQMLQDYAWVPRLTWKNDLNLLSQRVQFTRFKLKKYLLGDTRPNFVDRFVVQEDYTDSFPFISGDLDTNLHLHYVYDAFDYGSHDAFVPVLFAKWHKNLVLKGINFEPLVLLRVSRATDQSKLPILDSEPIQQNVTTWLDYKVYAGDDKFFDQSNITLAAKLYKSNWHAMFGVKHGLNSKEFALGIDYGDNFTSFMVYDSQKVRVFNADYSINSKDGVFGFGFRKDINLDLTKHWYLRYKKNYFGFDVDLNYAFIKHELEFFYKGGIGIIRKFHCWDLGLTYKWQKINSHPSWQEISFNINLLN